MELSLFKVNRSMYSVYALRSLKRNYIYVGISNDIVRRVRQHNRGYNKTTRPYRPFKLIYTRNFESRIMARNHEKYMKSGAGKELLKLFEYRWTCLPAGRFKIQWWQYRVGSPSR